MKRFVMMLGVAALAATGVQGQVLYFTGATGNQIWQANRDGSGAPVVVHSPAAVEPMGPNGIEWSVPMNALFYAGARNFEFYTASADGSGTPSVLPGTAGGTANHVAHDIAVDVAGNRLFLSIRDSGIYSCDLPCNVTTLVFPDVSSSFIGLEYDPTSDSLYFTGNDGTILTGAADGSSGPTVLFDAADGVQNDAPRNLALDPANGRLYWVQHADGASGSGEVLGANMDGSGTVDLLYTVPEPFLPFGIDVDVQAGRLFWTEFDSNNESTSDRIMVGDTDGSGVAQVLHAGDFGNVRGITLGTGAVVALEVPTLSTAWMVLVGLLLGVAGVLRLRAS